MSFCKFSVRWNGTHTYTSFWFSSYSFSLSFLLVSLFPLLLGYTACASPFLNIWIINCFMTHVCVEDAKSNFSTWLSERCSWKFHFFWQHLPLKHNPLFSLALISKFWKYSFLLKLFSSTYELYWVTYFWNADLSSPFDLMTPWSCKNFSWSDSFDPD